MEDECRALTIGPLRIDVTGSVLSIIPLKDMAREISLEEKPQRGKEGDLALVRVSKANEWRSISMQNLHGRAVHVFPGDLVLGVLGLRQSTTHSVGFIPDSRLSRGCVLHLLSEGGIIGRLSYIPGFMGAPIILDYEGMLRYRSQILNTADFGLPPIEHQSLPPLLLIAGTTSEIGKTTLACRVINYLSRGCGLSVSSLMMSGTGSKNDALEHRNAGARAFHSFIEAGLSNSYGMPGEQYVAALKNLLYHMVRKEKPDVIVGELGGDFVWGNNDAILKDPEMRKATRLLIVIASDVVSAVGTMALFREWKINTPMVFANSWQRSYGGMSLRFEKILAQPLLDVNDRQAVEETIRRSLPVVLPFPRDRAGESRREKSAGSLFAGVRTSN